MKAHTTASSKSTYVWTKVDEGGRDRNGGVTTKTVGMRGRLHSIQVSLITISSIDHLGNLETWKSYK